MDIDFSISISAHTGGLEPRIYHAICHECGCSPCTCHNQKERCHECGCSPCTCHNQKERCHECGCSPCTCHNQKERCHECGCSPCTCHNQKERCHECGHETNASDYLQVVAPPKISQFVLYAERSISLGDHDTVFRGDIGVRSIAQSDFGTQLKVGNDSIIERSHILLSPSVSMGEDVTVGLVQTNTRQDNGIALRTQMAFPASAMPPLPLAQRRACGPRPDNGGSSVTVGGDQVVALNPGIYDALLVTGTAVLNPGNYSFCSVTLADFSRLVAIAGDVKISIRDYLTTGRSVRIYPAFHATADRLTISVSGSNKTGSPPVVSIGEHSSIRALVVAPHGTISFADHVRATGAFAGFDLDLGEHVRVDFECGFPTGVQGGSQQLHGYYGIHPDPSVAPVVAPIPADTNISLAIGLPVRDPQGLKTLIKQVSDPRSSNFRKYLTQTQFRSTFGATDSDYSSLQRWAESSGFNIRATYSNNLLLTVIGTASQIEEALFVNLVYRQRRDGDNFVAVDRDPSLNLTTPILEINGLTDFLIPHHATASPSSSPPPPPARGTTTGGDSNTGPLYAAVDIRNAYLGVGSDLQSLDGTGQVVGIVDWDTFNQSDITDYHNAQVPAEGQPPLLAPNVQIVAREGPPPWPRPPVPNAKLESTLDIEMVLSYGSKRPNSFFPRK